MGTAKTATRLWFVIVLIVTMVFTMMPLAPLSAGTAFAQTSIGTITVGGTTTQYTEYRPLKLALEKLKGKEVSVEMLTDWDNSISGMTVSERLKIPEGSKITLNMNGHVFNRDMTKDNSAEDDGEVILVMKGATLTVNGGTKDTSHAVYVYNSTEKKAKPVKGDDIAGGLITGGDSKDGAGGIHVYAGGNLTLNKVTIAGCRATDKGYGGGIYLGGETHNVVLKNSTITGCFAGKDGGGIYAEPKKGTTITLDNSHIDKNYANSDGGGMNPDGDATIINGTDGSTISNNKCENRGGGLLLYGYKCNVSDLTIKGNKAKNGGGVYVQRYGSALSNLDIEYNTATEDGGGIYFNDIKEEGELKSEIKKKVDKSEKDGTVRVVAGHGITSCTIQNNTAKTAGGVYLGSGFHTHYGPWNKGLINVYAQHSLSLQKKVIIQGNTSTGNNDYKNLYSSSKYWSYNRIGTDLTEGSNVRISFKVNAYDVIIMLTPNGMKDTNSTQYLFSDQDGWYFKYSDGKTERVRGRKPEQVDPTKVDWTKANDASAKEDGNYGTTAGKVGKVGAGGGSGSNYDLIRFFSDHESHDFISAVYYSDGLFYGDPYSYNEHLATASWALAYAGGYLNKDEKADANGNVYYNKHAAARQYLADIGCPDQKIYVNDSMVRMPGADTIGVTIGSKELKKANGNKTGDILIPITVRCRSRKSERSRIWY